MPRRPARTQSAAPASTPAAAPTPLTSTALDYGLALRQLARINLNLVEKALTAAGTTLAQWSVLRSIELAPGASGTDLAAAAFVTPQALGEIVRRLEQQRLVERRPGRGRVIEHYLTEEGRSQAEAGAAAVDAVHRRTLSPLSATDRTQLVTLLERLRDTNATRDR